MAGLVIGRGGSTIKSIQQNSGATIKLSNGATEDTRIVKITGSEDAQRLAYCMVEKITENSTPPPRPRHQTRGRGTGRGRSTKRPVSPLDENHY